MIWLTEFLIGFIAMVRIRTRLLISRELPGYLMWRFSNHFQGPRWIRPYWLLVNGFWRVQDEKIRIMRSISIHMSICYLMADGILVIVEYDSNSGRAHKIPWCSMASIGSTDDHWFEKVAQMARATSITVTIVNVCSTNFEATIPPEMLPNTQKLPLKSPQLTMKTYHVCSQPRITPITEITSPIKPRLIWADTRGAHLVWRSKTSPDSLPYSWDGTVKNNPNHRGLSVPAGAELAWRPGRGLWEGSASEDRHRVWDFSAIFLCRWLYRLHGMPRCQLRNHKSHKCQKTFMQFKRLEMTAMSGHCQYNSELSVW